MPAISLMSFLKILTKGSPQKAQEYGKYLRPGGYQFYWMLQNASRAMTIDGKGYADCLKPMQVITRDVERECNMNALKALNAWMRQYEPDAYFTAPNGNCLTPGGYVTVKLEPEFGLVKDGHRRIVQLWYSKNTTLSKHAVMLGTHLIQKHLCVGDFADCKAGILDLRRRELLVVNAGTPAVMEVMVATEFAWIDAFFKAHEDAAKAA